LLLWHERTRPKINAARSLDDLPLVVLSVTEQPFFAEVLTRLQKEQAGLSRNSTHTVVAGATHESLVANREHARAVAAAIRQVLEAARTGQQLSDLSD
jgi:hypothetical protein